MYVETRYFFIFQNISGATNFKKLWVHFKQETKFLNKKHCMSLWTGVHQKLDFFYMKELTLCNSKYPYQKNIQGQFWF